MSKRSILILALTLAYFVFCWLAPSIVLFFVHPEMPTMWFVVPTFTAIFWTALWTWSYLHSVPYRSMDKVMVGVKAASVLVLALLCLLGVWAWHGVWTTSAAYRIVGDPSATPAQLRWVTEARPLDYDLDNRVASHPRSPSDLLFTLYEKDQQGTWVSLAQNPRTPPELLRKLEAKNDPHVNQVLEAAREKRR